MELNQIDAPIGVFDSGIGGFTVLKEIHTLMPNENIVYFGDTARVPYGSKSKETVIRYSRQIFTFLLKRRVKYIVVACNTASAYALEPLKSKADVPVMGVVEPGVDALIRKTNGSGSSALIATAGTVKSRVYEKTLKRKGHELKIYSKACPLFVPLVEEGLVEHKITEEVVKLYLNDLHKKNISELILGCTHYPILKGVIQKIYPRFHLIDSSQETAAALKASLKKASLLNQSDQKGKVSVYVSDSVESLAENKMVDFKIENSLIKKISL